MSDWIDLGRHTGCRLSEILAYHDDEEPDTVYALSQFEGEGVVKATILLRNGQKLPCYVSGATLAKRLRAAEGERF